jgi:asparagine synthase (glutamine-hydrolysing)
MCGLLGQVGGSGDRAGFERALDLLAHRGPDGQGIFEGKAAGESVRLGHRRLAIIDLSERGAQPMTSADGRYTVTYNGEIFNFLELRSELARDGVRFRSQSDTEVLLEAFVRQGPAVFRRFNGMFALAIFDGQTGELTLARDHLGVKPLYWSLRGRTFTFASEIKAMFALGVPARLRRSLLGEYLAQMWIQEPDTLFEGVFKLPAGQWGRYRDGEWRAETFWDIGPAALERAPRDPLEQLAHLVEDATRMQLVADRPVGAYISGGVDSSVITRLALETKPQLIAVSARFSKTDRHYEGVADDGLWADRFAAAHPGLDHRSLVLAPDLYDRYRDLIWNLDEPIADSATVPAFLLAQEARRAGAVVMLSGMGGDELFAGYSRYSGVQWAGMTRALPSPLRAGLSALVGMAGRMGGGGLRRRASHAERFLDAAKADWPASYSSFIGHYGSEEIDGLVGAEWRGPHQDKMRRVLAGFESASRLTQAQRLDLKGFLASHNLIYSDKASMAASVEVRVPLLDYRLAELAFSLPGALRATRGKQKVLLKALCARLVSPDIAYRPKAGFAMPVRAWLRSGLEGVVRQAVLGERLSGLMEPSHLKRLFEDHYSGRAENTWKLWTLLTLDLWLERFQVQVGA